MGLSAYEYSFGRGFTLGEETAKILGENAKQNDILISVHAPYYINLANESDEMAEKSFGYILKSLKFLDIMQGERVVVHLASCGKQDRDQALLLTQKRLEKVVDLAYQNFDMSNKLICPETMGKMQQIGTYKEIIDFCTMDKCLVPTFDFGHINCIMQGGLKSPDDYKQIFDYAFEKLGERARSPHVHFSKIEYGAKGEIKHLNMDDVFYGPFFEHFVSVIKEYNLTPVIICESADKMAEDSILMKSIYENS